MRKPLTLLLAAILCLSLFGCGNRQADETNPEAIETTADESEVVILYTGNLNISEEMTDASANLQAISDYAQTLRDAGKDVIMIDGGCAASDNSYTANAIELLNNAGYSVATAGRTELSGGVETFLLRSDESAQFSYLCANLNESGNPFFAGNKTVEYETCTVAFVGISSPAFLNNEDASQYSMYGETPETLYDRVQIMLDAARADGADYVVLLTNMGEKIEGDDTWDIYSLIANTEGADLILDAGSKQVVTGNCIINKNNEDTAFCSAGSDFNGICEIHIGTVTGKIYVQTLNLQTDGESKSLAVDCALHEVLGEEDEEEVE